MTDWIRTTAFRIFFYTLSVPIVLFAPAVALFGTAPLHRYAHGWSALMCWSVRVFLGIDVVGHGQPIAGPALYAAKHQSMFETLELARRLNGPTIVMKQELMRIPVWGFIARRYGAIVVDRSASAAALRSMVTEARAAIASGRSVLIFPEGTRVRPGERPPLKAGFAGLYKMLGVPVVPIALNSGLVWPLHGPMHGGTITIRFGDTIPVGLPRARIEGQVHHAINVLEK